MFGNLGFEKSFMQDTQHKFAVKVIKLKQLSAIFSANILAGIFLYMVEKIRVETVLKYMATGSIVRLLVEQQSTIKSTTKKS